MSNIVGTMIDSWRPLVKSIIKGALIVGLGTIVHELGHYITVKASGGEVLRFEYNPITAVVTMTVEAPASAYPLIRLSGGLAEAAYYALLSMIDRKLLIPASLWAGFAYFEMEQNHGALAVLGALADLSVYLIQIFNIPEGEIV